MSATRPDINTHPKTLSASSIAKSSYDVIVIGGGPGGESTAARCTRGGLTALLVEAELCGGECPYWACVPSKALLRPGETFAAGKSVGGARERLALLSEKYGIKPEIDLEGMWNRRDGFAKNWDDSFMVGMMHKAGVDVAHGFGSILGVKKVGIKDWHTGEMVEAEAKHAVVVSTGSAAVIPKIEGLEDSKYWSPREAVSAREVPEHLIILGAGAVGVEMATVYREMGSKVTLIAHKILGKMCDEAGKMVEESMIKAGVVIEKAGRASKVSRDGKKITVTLSNGSTVQGTELLIATGRNARTAGLGLEEVGGPKEGAWIEVDDSMCATAIVDGWLYSVGDPNGRALMTHVSKYQAKVAGDSIVAKAKATHQNGVATGGIGTTSVKPSNLAIPQGVFSDPQVASTGLTAKLAASKGLKAKTVSVKMAGPGIFLHAEGFNGWAQWVVEEGSNKLLGATFVGQDVVDLVHASTVAIVGGMTTDQLWHVMPPFPTMSEVYTSLSEALEG